MILFYNLAVHRQTNYGDILEAIFDIVLLFIVWSLLSERRATKAVPRAVFFYLGRFEVFAEITPQPWTSCWAIRRDRAGAEVWAGRLYLCISRNTFKTVPSMSISGDVGENHGPKRHYKDAACAGGATQD